MPEPNVTDNNKNAQKSKTIKWIVIGVVAIILIGVIFGVSGGPTSTKTTNEQNISNPSKNKKDFAQNEVVTYKGVEYSIVNVEKTQGSNQFMKPDSGYEYVKVTIRIENKSNEKISYNGLDWAMVNTDGQEDTWGTVNPDDDKELNSGDLDVGGKVEGVIVFEEKVGDNNLRLRYYDNMFDSEYSFQFKLD